MEPIAGRELDGWPLVLVCEGAIAGGVRIELCCALGWFSNEDVNA